MRMPSGVVKSTATPGTLEASRASPLRAPLTSCQCPVSRITSTSETVGASILQLLPHGPCAAPHRPLRERAEQNPRPGGSAGPPVEGRLRRQDRLQQERAFVELRYAWSSRREIRRHECWDRDLSIATAMTMRRCRRRRRALAPGAFDHPGTIHTSSLRRDGSRRKSPPSTGTTVSPGGAMPRRRRSPLPPGGYPPFDAAHAEERRKTAMMMLVANAIGRPSRWPHASRSCAWAIGMRGRTMDHVLRHDDGGIDKQADRDCQSAERHQYSVLRPNVRAGCRVMAMDAGIVSVTRLWRLAGPRAGRTGRLPRTRRQELPPARRAAERMNGPARTGRGRFAR